MKRYFKAAVFFLAAGLLASCASGPKFTEFQPEIIARSPEMGRVFFYRPSALGAALRPNVILNDKKVGEAVAKGFFFVDLPPGDYTAVTSTEVKRKVSFRLESGQTRFVRFSTSFGFFVGHVYGELVDNSVAMAEIKDCHYTGDQKAAQ